MQHYFITNENIMAYHEIVFYGILIILDFAMVSVVKEMPDLNYCFGKSLRQVHVLSHNSVYCCYRETY